MGALKGMLDDQDVLPKTPDALFEALNKVRFDRDPQSCSASSRVR